MRSHERAFANRHANKWILMLERLPSAAQEMKQVSLRAAQITRIRAESGEGNDSTLLCTAAVTCSHRALYRFESKDDVSG